MRRCDFVALVGAAAGRPPGSHAGNIKATHRASRHLEDPHGKPRIAPLRPAYASGDSMRGVATLNAAHGPYGAKHALATGHNAVRRQPKQRKSRSSGTLIERKEPRDENWH